MNKNIYFGIFIYFSILIIDFFDMIILQSQFLLATSCAIGVGMGYIVGVENEEVRKIKTTDKKRKG